MPRFSWPGMASPRTPGDARVETELRRRMRAQGRITFAEFMEVALYLPGGGYYQAHVSLGRTGDFLTSPETHPLFGALLTRLARAAWCALDRPAPFHVIEYGAGSGALCRQVVTAAQATDGKFAKDLRYVIVEASALLRGEQQARLQDLGEVVTWAPSAEMTEYAAGCVLANEVADALPVHRLRVEGERLHELYVARPAGEYAEVSGPLSTSELEAYFLRAGVRPPEGAVVEVCLEARPWLADAAARLARGYLALLDYGGAADDLYVRATPRGGLKCFSRHGWTDDPFDRPGLQDITAPVDFTDLSRAGEEAGWEASAEMTQRELLLALGAGRAGEQVAAWEGPVMERERNLRAMAALVAPEGLGRFRALIQRKGAPPLQYQGADMEATLYVPLLRSPVEEW